jgi:putative transposase
MAGPGFLWACSSGAKGGPSKYALALELLSYARNRLHCRPEYVLFDAWYPSKALLKRIRDYGWYFVCRLKKNRRFNGQPLRAYRRHPYWTESGWLSGGLKVLVVRYGAKYFATNRLTLPAAEVRRLYQVRAQIEEVIRVCKDQLGLNGCQARPERAQRHHLTCCLVAFCVLERERQDRGVTIYTLKRQLSCQAHMLALPALERLRQAA